MDHYATSEFVLVYRYGYWDPLKREVVLSSEMYTLDAIRDGLGNPETHTGIKVLRSEVDSQGRYGPGPPSAKPGGYLARFLTRRRSGSA